MVSRASRAIVSRAIVSMAMVSRATVSGALVSRLRAMLLLLLLLLLLLPYLLYVGAGDGEFHGAVHDEGDPAGVARTHALGEVAARHQAQPRAPLLQPYG